MAEVYGISATQASRLGRLLQAFERGELAGKPFRTPHQLLPYTTIFGTLDSAISPTTALTGPLKSGTMSIYTWTSTGGTTDTGVNETVWNAAKMQAVTGRWTAASLVSGRYLITFQAASTTGCT